MQSTSPDVLDDDELTTDTLAAQLNDVKNYYEDEIEDRDQKIRTLDEENTMLHLRMAKLVHQMKNQSEKITYLTGKIQDQTKIKHQWKGSILSLYTKFLALQDNYDVLRNSVADLPSQVQEQCTTVLKLASEKCLLVQDMTKDVHDLQHQLLNKDKLLEEISEQLSKERQKRKLLHNAVIELKGNIRVHCRVRPITYVDRKVEKDPSSLDPVIHVIDEETVGVPSSRSSKMFEFERVYFPTDTQETVFQEVQMLITSLFDGYNVCMMAYGQTGSGKTHTMLGKHEDELFDISVEPVSSEGIIPRAIREVFRIVTKCPPGDHSVELSIVEIYNNDVVDLLSSDLKVKHDVVVNPDGTVCMPSVTSRKTRNMHEVMELIRQGLARRHQSATKMHEHSSRSHLIVIVTLTTRLTRGNSSTLKDTDCVPKEKMTNAGSASKRGSSHIPRYAFKSSSSSRTNNESRSEKFVKTKLQLVDLAGSECIGVSEVKGVQLRETVHINKSLCALADVLMALAERRQHIPYRNSRLTYLLQDSIGGDSKLLIILCIAPTRSMMSESIQSLQFGQRARQIQREQIRSRSSSAPNTYKSPGMISRCGTPSPKLNRARAASLRTMTSELIL